METVHEKGSGTFNEDTLLSQHPLFAVFDGASSLSGQLHAGHSGAWWAANLAHATFETCSHAGLSLRETALLANTAIGTRMERMGVDAENPLNRWSASMAAFRINKGSEDSGDSLEYVQTGDSLIMCITDDSFFLPAPYVHHDRETLCQWKALNEAGETNVRQSLHVQICSVRANMNRTYGVLNGEEQAADFLQYGHVPLEGVRQIVAFTDGLHLPTAHPEQQTDFSAAARILRTRGLRTLHEQIRALECTDADCRLYPRFKQHDDIAAVAVHLA
ncbi:MAG: protein phosphatase 2C domain-containing protein [Halodesulfovibrio sp.]